MAFLCVANLDHKNAKRFWFNTQNK